MKDSALLWIAFTVGLIGLAILFFLYSTIDIEELSISEAKQLDEYDELRITGTVEAVTNKANVTIITVSKLESIDVVVFEKLDLESGIFVEILGEIGTYRRQKQILAKTITMINKS